MSLVVITGGARSGKSGAAQRLVQSRYEEAVVVVAAHADTDEEMARRIRKHREDRPAGFRTLEARAGTPWQDEVPDTDCVIIDCLGSLLSDEIAAAFDVSDANTPGGEVASEAIEDASQRAAHDLLTWVVHRTGDTVVVTNEVGGGIVPLYASARLFRDVVGRANRELIDAADAAYVAIAGRLIDLSSLPTDALWPTKERR